MNITIIILLLVIVILLFLNMFFKKDMSKSENKIDNNMPYRKKYLLTKNEWSFYKKIIPICKENNFHIIAKVRLADLVEIEKGLDKKQWHRYFNKIKNKHIDFVLCNPENLKVISLIELDDETHKRQDRIERDNFINNLCKKVGYNLIRVKKAEEFIQKMQNEK